VDQAEQASRRHDHGIEGVVVGVERIELTGSPDGSTAK